MKDDPDQVYKDLGKSDMEILLEELDVAGVIPLAVSERVLRRIAARDEAGGYGPPIWSFY